MGRAVLQEGHIGVRVTFGLSYCNRVGFGSADDRLTMPAPTSKPASARTSDMSVVLVTGSYDHEIRFWEAWSGICSRTIARSGESGVRFSQACVMTFSLMFGI